ncbi:MAG: type VI secretion system tube protein TssD [Sulfurimonas sp.]|nr:type VI secretion system tube protein TssD [Sulfurimonas sp.]
MNNIFMSIKGSSQGLISQGATSPKSIGNCHVHNHKDEILVKSFRFGASNAVHAGSGKVLGEGRSKPLVITKMTDKSSPLLFNAAAKNETLPEVVLKAYRIAYNGKHEHYLTVTLKDALIANIDINSTIENNLIETIYFVYKEITFEHVVASTVSQSKWKNGTLVFDKAMLDRIIKRAENNYKNTNDILEGITYDVSNAGKIVAYGVFKKLYNNDFNKKHRFIKNPLMSKVDFAADIWNEKRGGTRFKTSTGAKGSKLLRKVIYPAMVASFFFETGVAIGSFLDASAEEILGDCE